MSTSYTATFHPEAWRRGQAVPVEPQGQTTWDCTAAVNQRLDYFTRLFARDDSPVDVDDYLKDDPAAPEWIRSWSGPFTIRVTRSDDEPHEPFFAAGGSNALDLEGEPYTWDSP